MVIQYVCKRLLNYPGAGFASTTSHIKEDIIITDSTHLEGFVENPWHDTVSITLALKSDFVHIFAYPCEPVFVAIFAFQSTLCCCSLFNDHV